MKKLVASLLAALVLTACNYPHPTSTPKTAPAVKRLDLSETPDTTYFIELCSGIEITDDNEGIIAVANCLGRVRGYADGGMLSAQLYHTASPWCVPEQTTDYDVMQAVLIWVARNPERFAVFHKTFDPRTAASATIIQGLRETFNCRST